MVLTKSDFDALKDLMEVTIDEKLEEKLDQKLDEKLKYLPTKDEFYERTDQIMTELKDMREEMTVFNGRVADHGDRLEDLEKIHPHGHHVALAS